MELYARIVIVFILVLLGLCNRSDGFKLNILVVIVGENINNGYYACAPFFDTGFAEVMELYPRLYANATIRYIYEPKVIDCEESSYRMIVLFGKILPLVRQTNDTMTVLLTPGKLPPTLVMRRNAYPSEYSLTAFWRKGVFNADIDILLLQVVQRRFFR